MVCFQKICWHWAMGGDFWRNNLLEVMASSSRMSGWPDAWRSGISGTLGPSQRLGRLKQCWTYPRCVICQCFLEGLWILKSKDKNFPILWGSKLETPRFVVRMDASFLVSKVVSSFLDASAFPFAALAVWSSGLSKSLHKKCWVPEIWTKESRTVRSQLGSLCLVFKKPRLVFTVRCTAFWMKISTCFKNSTCEKITGDTLQRLPWNPLIYSWFSAIDKSLCVHHGFSLRWQLWRLRHTVASIQTTPSPLRRWVTLPWKSPFDPRNFI